MRETTLKRGIFVWKTRKTTISICWKPSCRIPRWGRTPSTSSCKAELLRQRNIYRQLNQEAHAAIDACGGSAQGQSAMAKLNTKVSIGMKTITDKSTRNLAEMLTQGSGMGVVDCIKSQKDYPDAAPGSKRLMQKLQDFEEDNRLKLEQYL